jgi:hypothetical protein
MTFEPRLSETPTLKVAHPQTPSWPHDQILHAWWVQPGRLLAGHYPGALDPVHSARKRKVLLDAGVDSIVDLTEPGERGRGGKRLLPYDELLCADAESRGLTLPRHSRHPIPDTNVIEDAGYDRILGHIRAELDAGRVVYVHCWGGKGRTGTVIGAWLIDSEGLDYESTLRRLQELRRGTCEADHLVPDEPVQHAVLRRRAARGRA